MGLTSYDILNKKRIAFNRTEGYRTLNGYKVRDTKNDIIDREVALKLDILQKKIDKMIQMFSSPGHLRTDPKINILLKDNRWILEGLGLLRSMHFKIKGVSEIPTGLYNGMNYPLGVHSTDKVPISRDGSLRPKTRQIYLKIRNVSDKNIKDVLIHELAHTLSNDVIYYSEHTPDFYSAEKVIKYMWKSCEFN